MMTIVNRIGFVRIVLIIILIIMYLSVVFVNHRMSLVQQKYDIIKAENATLLENNNKLEDSIRTMNAAFLFISNETDRHNLLMSSIAKQASDRNKSLQDKLLKISKESSPSTCDESIRYLIEARKDY